MAWFVWPPMVGDETRKGIFSPPTFLFQFHFWQGKWDRAAYFVAISVESLQADTDSFGKFFNFCKFSRVSLTGAKLTVVSFSSCQFFSLKKILKAVFQFDLVLSSFSSHDWDI
jgi:hypothetical protein